MVKRVAASVTLENVASPKAGRDNPNLTALGPDVFFAQDPRVALQIVNSVGQCWLAEFETTKANTVKKFKTRFLGIVIQ